MPWIRSYGVEKSMPPVKPVPLPPTVLPMFGSKKLKKLLRSSTGCGEDTECCSGVKECCAA